MSSTNQVLSQSESSDAASLRKSPVELHDNTTILKNQTVLKNGRPHLSSISSVLFGAIKDSIPRFDDFIFTQSVESIDNYLCSQTTAQSLPFAWPVCSTFDSTKYLRYIKPFSLDFYDEKEPFAHNEDKTPSRTKKQFDDDSTDTDTSHYFNTDHLDDVSTITEHGNEIDCQMLETCPEILSQSNIPSFKRKRSKDNKSVSTVSEYTSTTNMKRPNQKENRLNKRKTKSEFMQAASFERGKFSIHEAENYYKSMQIRISESSHLTRGLKLKEVSSLLVCDVPWSASNALSELIKRIPRPYYEDSNHTKKKYATLSDVLYQTPICQKNCIGKLAALFRFQEQSSVPNYSLNSFNTHDNETCIDDTPESFFQSDEENDDTDYNKLKSANNLVSESTKEQNCSDGDTVVQTTFREFSHFRNAPSIACNDGTSTIIPLHRLQRCFIDLMSSPPECSRLTVDDACVRNLTFSERRGLDTDYRLLFAALLSATHNTNRTNNKSIRLVQRMIEQDEFVEILFL